jgi:hypothetical protein
VSLGTRQRKVAVTVTGNGDDAFAECYLIHSAKRLLLCRVSASLHSGHLSVSLPSALLPSARVTALGKETLPVPRCSFSVECSDPDTRHKTSLPSVTLNKVTSTHLLYLFFLFYPNKQKISHIHHRYHIIITDITYTSYISQTP